MNKKANSRQLSLLKPLIPTPDTYYSGEQQNPYVTQFVLNHLSESGYTVENDRYEMEPTIDSISSTKRTPIYSLHAYDSKKPPDALQKYIEHFTSPGDLVLDPFVGSGMTAIASLLSNRKCIAADLSPLATFITANCCSPLASQDLSAAAERALGRAMGQLPDIYSTICGSCNGPATIYFTVFSQTYKCPRCLELITLFDALPPKESVDQQEGDGGFKAQCPSCTRRGKPEKISNRLPRQGSVPVLIEYTCECTGSEHRIRQHNDTNEREREIFHSHDLPKIQRAEQMALTHWYPQRPMMWCPNSEGTWGQLWRPYHGEIRRVDQFFTKRNLIVLSTLLASIEQEADKRLREAMRFLFTAFVLSQSKLQRYHPGSTFPNMIAPGLLYVAPMIKEYNAFQWYKGKVHSSLKAWEGLSHVDPSQIIVTTQSASDLSNIPSNSIDYILTDPPYSGKIQYAELNFIQEAWLGFENNWLTQEVIVNTPRNKTENDWADLLRPAIAECYRVLKPGRWLSLCYHDSSEGTWALIQDILAEVGFISEKSKGAIYIDVKQKSLKQITAEKVTKRDLVINFRKPRPDEIRPDLKLTDDDDQNTFTQKVLNIITAYLSANPGTTKDRVYDEVVGRLVRQGQFERHNFDELLLRIAEPAEDEARHWFLKESTEEKIEQADAAKEEDAAKHVTDLITKFLELNPHLEGVHYSDIFEYYIYTVKDKPRRQLQDWLLDFFYLTSEGTYRLPSGPEEINAKLHGRAAGLNRRIKRFIAYLQHLNTLPSHLHPDNATLADWIRHCKKSGLYQQGKLLFERGGLSIDKLPEDVLVAIEEDYQICVRMLAKATKPVKTRKKSESGK